MRLAAGAGVAGTAFHAGQSRAQQEQVNDEGQAAYAATQGPPSAPPTAAPAAPTDAAAEIERLARLHSSGALTDEEFAAAKAKVLDI
jgi:hypothetical protein